jgi:hypothetical protein
MQTLLTTDAATRFYTDDPDPTEMMRALGRSSLGGSTKPQSGHRRKEGRKEGNAKVSEFIYLQSPATGV